ncbi:MAG: hypothetical protein M3Y77_10705 [Actinomycetota bacterium]|nr:hypothetical protein [Actinomycetota bacterium]
MTTTGHDEPQPRRSWSRRKSVVITLACGLVTMAGCLLVNAVTGSPIQWYWLMVAPLYVTLLIAGFLWVRLTANG